MSSGQAIWAVPGDSLDPAWPESMLSWWLQGFDKELDIEGVGVGRHSDGPPDLVNALRDAAKLAGYVGIAASGHGTVQCMFDIDHPYVSARRFEAALGGVLEVCCNLVEAGFSHAATNPLELALLGFDRQRDAISVIGEALALSADFAAPIDKAVPRREDGSVLVGPGVALTPSETQQLLALLDPILPERIGPPHPGIVTHLSALPLSELERTKNAFEGMAIPALTSALALVEAEIACRG